MKLTPWFPADVKPVHVGVYEIYENKRSERRTFKHWNGRFWGFASRTIMDAQNADALGPSIIQKCKWRGLAEPPKKAKAK